MRVCVLLLALFAFPLPASAERFAIDLASGVSTATFSRPVGTTLQFTLTHKLPKGVYKVIVETRTIDIPPLPNPGTQVTLAGPGDPCEARDGDVTAVYAAKDEKEVVAPAAAIRAAIAANACATDPARAARLQRALEGTEEQLPGTYDVRRGEQIIVTITRGDKAWVYTFSGGARGAWLTSYGASVVPDRSTRMTLKADGTNGFVITPEAEPEGPRVLPSIFFTWLPAQAESTDWSNGPTAGLGVDSKSPSLFAGWSASYNRNLMFVAGVALAQHKVLKRRYTAGEVVKENLEEDQLLQGAYKPSWLVAVTFRFGENPFGEAAPKKPADKPAEKPGGKQ